MKQSTQDTAKRKGDKAVVVFFVISALVFAIAIPSANQYNKKVAEQRAAVEEQKRQADIQAVEAIVLPIAQAHGITDLKISSIEEPYNVTVYGNSDSFSQMSDEEKLLFLVAVSQKEREEGITFPEESDYRWEDSFDFFVISGDYIYKDAVFSGKSELWRNTFPSKSTYYETVFEMDTDYAQIVTGDLHEWLNSDDNSSSGGEKCYWCNGTGSVRYNYGSSDLEAILSGHDPYTYGTCASCGGTGKAK